MPGPFGVSAFFLLTVRHWDGYNLFQMPIQTHLTPILLPKTLHARLKAIVRAKGAGIQETVTLELERFVTREEAKQKRVIV